MPPGCGCCGWQPALADLHRWKRSRRCHVATWRLGYQRRSFFTQERRKARLRLPPPRIPRRRDRAREVGARERAVAGGVAGDWAFPNHFSARVGPSPYSATCARSPHARRRIVSEIMPRELPTTDTEPTCGFCLNALGRRDPYRECSACRTWGAVFWRYVRMGCDRSDAAFRADAWEQRQKGNTP